MQTDNPAIKALVRDLNAGIVRGFQGRAVSVFIMGSLARGGFSEVSSDIDIGIVFDGALRKDDGAAIDKIRVECANRHPSIKNNVSVFWGSIDSLNGVVVGGRYPPFDRLDLIDHASLLAGADIRGRLARPSQQELEIAGARFALEKLASPARIEEFKHCKLMASKGNAYVAKTILFSARFIYLEKTGLVAGNDVSCRYYIAHFTGVDTDLVGLGYELRFESADRPAEALEKALRDGLTSLYRRFIDIYVERMETYGEHSLARELGHWKSRLSAMKLL